MHVLISNDDGVYAAGILSLYEELRTEHKCTVVAPDRDRSGVSSALTLDKPLYPRILDNGFISIDGNPCDCVHLSLNGLLEQKPDVVVSGINLGANLGDDVMYSGTVAAALEGRFLDYPALAISLTSSNPIYLDTAAFFAGKIVNYVNKLELPKRTILNINVPDLPLSEIKGVILTRLGHRGQAHKLQPVINPRGKKGYWISAAPAAIDCSEGTDFHAISTGFVSITPLRFDRTCSESEISVKQLVADLCRVM